MIWKWITGCICHKRTDQDLHLFVFILILNLIHWHCVGCACLWFKSYFGLRKLINIGASPPTFRLFKWPLTPGTWDGHITSLSSGVWLLTPCNISSVTIKFQCQIGRGPVLESLYVNIQRIYIEFVDVIFKRFVNRGGY